MNHTYTAYGFFLLALSAFTAVLRGRFTCRWQAKFFIVLSRMCKSELGKPLDLV